MSVGYIQVELDRIPDPNSEYYNHMKEWEKHHRFNAVDISVYGDEIHIVAGGRKYLFLASQWYMTLTPLAC